jgi:transcriptional regulator with XRE-family HTH domain
MFSKGSRNRDSVILSEAGRRRFNRLRLLHGYSIPSLIEASGVSETPIKKVLAGIPVDLKTLQKLAETLKVEVSDLIEARDWQAYCSQRISAHMQLTTLPILSREGTLPTWQEYQVDVLLEHRKPELPLRRSTYYPHEGSDLFALSESDIERTYSQQELFNKVFSVGQVQAAKQIAVIGAVGVGKSNCLQSFAHWLLAHPELGIPIWIPISELRDRTIHQYLCEHWLTGERISQLDWEELLAEFSEGRVWLFLDAVDEVGANAMSALAKLNAELAGWLARANTVVSCRSNVWDLESNPLRERFEVYCIKPLQYGNKSRPKQIEKFIQARFRENPKLGDDLRHRLDRSENKSLRDLVSNPFCLELLCYLWKIWHRSQNRLRKNRLPQSRFGLYECYVHYLVDVWRSQSAEPVEVILSPIFRAIQVLALRALFDELSPFRMRYSFILKVWRSEGFDPQWLLFLKEKGILNLIGKAQENPLDDVWAFLHPVLHEYFAVNAIHRPQVLFDPSSNPGNYGALEPHLREVVLLYLERPIPDPDKEALLQALVDFNDKFSGYYSFRARLLVASGVNCHDKFIQKEKIIAQIANWSCRTIDLNKSGFVTLSPQYIEKMATQALLETDSVQALASLRKLLKETSKNDIETRLRIIDRLIQVEGGETIAFKEIRYLLRKSQSLDTQIQARPALYKYYQIYESDDVSSLNQIIAFLISVMRDENLTIHRLKAALALREINPQHPEILTTLNRLRYVSDRDVFQIAEILHQWLTVGKPAAERLLYGEGGYYRHYSLEEIDALLEESWHQLYFQKVVSSEVLTKLAMAVKSDGNFRFTFQGDRLVRLFSIFVRIIRNYSAATGQDEIDSTPQLLVCFELINICSEQLSYTQVLSAWLSAAA